MKLFIFMLLLSGFFIFYICNAEWIDMCYETLVENYFGIDIEEVPLFESSVDSGTEDFDRQAEQLKKAQSKNPRSLFITATALAMLTLFVLLHHSMPLMRECKLLKRGKDFVVSFYKSAAQAQSERNDHLKQSKEEIQNLVTEILENNLKLGTQKEEVPVELLWKGGTLAESSVHCCFREDADSKCHKSSKAQVKTIEIGAGDELDEDMTPTSSDASTTHKMAEIRRLLESEPEIIQRVKDKCAGTEDFSEGMMTELRECLESEIAMAKAHDRENSPRQQCKRVHSKAETDSEKEETSRQTSQQKFAQEVIDNFSSESLQPTSDEEKMADEVIGDQFPNTKLMNRIRLLESRLRLEELKNRNWISRMSRAEGILQQLNKQVERIEERRPVETLTETLKITSTVTNWMPLMHPRPNHHFTLVNTHPSYFLHLPFASLTDVVRREVGLPFCGDYNRNTVLPLPPPPPFPPLPSPTSTSQTSFLSKFLSK